MKAEFSCSDLGQVTYLLIVFTGKIGGIHSVRTTWAHVRAMLDAVSDGWQGYYKKFAIISCKTSTVKSHKETSGRGSLLYAALSTECAAVIP